MSCTVIHGNKANDGDRWWYSSADYDVSTEFLPLALSEELLNA